MINSNQLLNEIDDAIIVLNLMADGTPGSVVEANLCAYNVLGYTSHEFSKSFVLESGLYSILSNDFASISHSAGQCTVQFEYNLPHKDGHKILFHFKAFKEKWKGSSCLFMIGKVICDTGCSTIDIANSAVPGISLAQASLASGSEGVSQCLQLSELIIDHNFTPILITDRNIKIIKVNKAFSSLFGYQEDELKGLHPRVLDSGLMNSETAHTISQSLKSTGQWQGQLTEESREGKALHLRVIIQVIKDNEGEPDKYVALFEDYSELAEMESELKRSYHVVQNNFEELLEIKSDLEQSYKRLEAVITGSNSGTWEWNMQTGETLYNERWAEIIGYSLAELSPLSIKTWKDHAHPADLLLSDQKVEEYLGGKTDIYYCQARMKHKDGHWVWIEDRGKVTEWDHEHKPLKMSGTHTDITELVQSRITLKHQLEIEALIAAISTDLTDIDVKNTDDKIQSALSAVGKFSEVDRSYLFLIADTGDEISNTHEWCAGGIEPQIQNLQNLPAESIPWWMEKMHREEIILFQHISEMPAQAATEKEILQAQNIISILVVPVYCAGELIGFIGFDSVKEEKIWSDFDVYTLRTFATSVANAIVSARSQKKLLVAKEKAESSEKQLHSLIANMFEGVANCKLIFENDIPADLLILEVNAVFDSLTGLSGVRGKKLSEVLPSFFVSDSGLFDILSRVALSGIPEKFETLVKSLDSWFSVSVYSMSKGNVVCVFNNSTISKRAEEEIKLLNSELEKRVARRTAKLQEAYRDMEAFSYSLSHDLQSPLRSIDGFAYILLDEYADILPHEGKHMVQVILDTSAKMSNLIQDMLMFSRMGNNEISKASIDMTAMAESVYNELTTPVQREHIEFIIRDLPAATGDVAMIKQLWVNLIGNAIKYSSKRPYPTIDIGVNIHYMGNIYYVKDNGVGFDMCYANKLFHVFQRLNASKDFDGNGVGLAIVDRIIKRHNGHIWADAKVNEGATFYFTLNDNKADKVKKRKSPQ